LGAARQLVSRAPKLELEPDRQGLPVAQVAPRQPARDPLQQDLS